MDASSETTLEPEQIRALRGDLSRAAFARRLEVTPHAVYRWELPRGSKEARSPRGRERRLLDALRAGAATAADPANVAPVPADVLRLFAADPRNAHAELLDTLGSAPLDPAQRAHTAAALAVHAAFHHFDAERALLPLGPALDWVRSSAPAASVVTSWVHAADAVAHALPSHRWFSPPRVLASAELALGAGADDASRVITACALTSAAALTGDDTLTERGLEALVEVRRERLPDLLAAHFDELQALRMLFHGEAGSARELLQRLVSFCERLDCAPLTSRVLGFLAMRQLDDLSDPDAALALALRARSVAEQARLGGGLHEAFFVRAELEAHARRGDLAASLRTIAAHEQSTETAPYTRFPALASGARVRLLAGNYAELDARAAHLRASCTGFFAEAGDAHAAFMEALASYGRGDDVRHMMTAFERAEAKAHRSELLRRDVLLYGTGAVLAAAQPTTTHQWLRRTQRQVDRFPTLWSIAHLRRLEGLVAATEGDWPRARAQLQTALAAFDVAADRIGASMVRWLYASLASANGESPGAVPDPATARHELEASGLVLPVTMVRGVATHCARQRPAAPAPHAGSAWATRLLVPVSRLAVRGADHALLERELLAILDDLFTPRRFRLDAIDSSGNATALGPSATAVEFGDGSGRRLRVSTDSSLDEEERAAMTVLASVTSLALESSQTRSFGTTSAARPEAEAENLEGFVAVSPSLRALRRDIKTLAASSATVVITGESGTGKEVVARSLHDASTRARGPFVAFNCATVPRELFEGQLFGHKRGAFTGATSDRIGVLSAAEGGTLFLDEIAELPLDVQPKLLRFLENHEVTPLGSTRSTRVDARILAATHRDLGALVRSGAFREDLFFRLQVVRLWMPPLRERREDILPLARHFLGQLSPQRRVELSPAAAARLAVLDYPGNVRELRNIVERSLAYAPGASVLDVEMLRLGDR